MSNNNSIIEKIAKLMALGKSPNESEALAALGKAQKLMSKYSIDQSVIENALGKMGNQFVKQEVSMGHSRFKDWEQYLMMYICESNFCKVVFQVNSDIIVIYGTQYDSEMCIALYAFIRPQMIQMANIAHKQSYTAINGKEWKHSYFMGMITKIKQLLKQVLQIVAEENNSTAIVLQKNTLVEAFYNDNKGKVITNKLSFNPVHNAYLQGYKDGDKLQLGNSDKPSKPNGLLG